MSIYNVHYASYTQTILSTKPMQNPNRLYQTGNNISHDIVVRNRNWNWQSLFHWCNNFFVAKFQFLVLFENCIRTWSMAAISKKCKSYWNYQLKYRLSFPDIHLYSLTIKTIKMQNKRNITMYERPIV